MLGCDTYVFPTIQMGVLGIRHDQQTITRLLDTTPKDSRLAITSPYLNLTDEYIDLILQGNGKANIDIITASPKVFHIIPIVNRLSLWSR